ncbi:CHRD domain-containing protein [Segetibacter koreensis]|uniref:CHRD domain-containing protein n=1 Tax=Segetibacter koreensis TaxID=398037 RepID=UPI000382B4D9|nr:CHRD domain-containing protein [Segetibacter koreensis]
MKTVFGFTARLLIFAVLIAGIYSYKNVNSDLNISAANNDSVTKKGIALTGDQEVPAVSPSGSGTLDVSYDKSTKTLSYSASWTGMTDSVTMMHFHGPAEKGTNAGVVYPIPDFTPGTAGTAKGTVKLDEVKLKEADLLGGKWYYNIHTKTHPGGEIRGQVEF